MSCLVSNELYVFKCERKINLSVTVTSLLVLSENDRYKRTVIINELKISCPPVAKPVLSSFPERNTHFCIFITIILFINQYKRNPIFMNQPWSRPPPPHSANVNPNTVCKWGGVWGS
jgi:hypothetical protein